MEDTVKIKGYKKGSLLHFERDGKRIAFDLKDLSFYRPLKSGKMRPLKAGQSFFRHLTATDVADGFNEKAYAELIKKVDRSVYRLTNFASLFAKLEKFKHLESYLLLGLDVAPSAFKNPVSQFPKEVIEFLKELNHTYDTSYLETNFHRYPDIVTNLFSHVRRRYYLDLEVYRMAYNLVAGYSFEKFVNMISPVSQEVEVQESWSGRKSLAETPYGCEYKTLFDYLVMIDRTEGLSFSSAMGEYLDYLKMMREMTRKRIVAKMKETNPSLDEWTIGWVGYNKVEKYPKYLRVRHDIVAKNYRAWVNEVDEKEFRSRVEYRYEFSKRGSKYRIIAPQKSDDIRNEGTALHHCVASYVSRVMDGHTQILFLREEENESLVTVEVRANAIVQARGYNNRNINEKEKEFLKVFAKAKNLDYLSVKRNPKMPTPPIVALQKYDADAAILRELSLLANKG